MTKSTVNVDKNIKRPPGRPPTGHDPALSARVPKDVLDRVDRWAAANECTRSVAVAKLLEYGLDSSNAARPRVAKALKR
jgi:hypothetical protein